MLFYTGLIFLVIAVSLDGFGVGVTYCMRKIHVPHSALFIIMLCSGIFVLLSMTIVNMLSTFISPQIAKIIGGCILISLGIFSLFNIMRERSNGNRSEEHTSELQSRGHLVCLLLLVKRKT